MSILIRPIITEQSMMEASRGKYTFQVDMQANKHQIAEATAKSFGVHPVAVHTVIVKGQTKRSLKVRKTFEEPKIKKAVVQLKAGEKIDLFDMTEGTNSK